MNRPATNECITESPPAETKETDGIVYVLSNPSMPGLLKIGRTSGEDPQRRIKGLYNTSVPEPFFCEIAVRVDDAPGVETAIFAMLAKSRRNRNREFFAAEPSMVMPMLRLLAQEDVTPDEFVVADEPDDAAPRTQRPRFEFGKLGITIGTELRYAHTDDTAVVASERTVMFREQEVTLTRAAHMVRGNEDNVDGPALWRHEGESLRSIYRRKY